MGMTQDRAEQIALSINAVLITCEAVVVPGPSGIGEWYGREYCVTIFDKEPVLDILCIFDDGEVLYEPQEAIRVIEDWDHDAREWLMSAISAEVAAERDAAAADAIVRLRAHSSDDGEEQEWT